VMRAAPLVLMLSGLLAAVPLRAQHALSASDSAFFAAARRASMKYRAQDAAIVDGFRPVGVEFPAMGEHWVSLPRVMEDLIDPARPSVLIYVTVNGVAMLGGVGYTDLLRPGEPPPSAPARSFWHAHNGTVADESFPLAHQMGHSSDGVATGDSLRLMVLHVWTAMPNASGPFSTDNWSLPLRRLGRERAVISSTAVRGIALAQDSSGYFALALRTALLPTEREERIIEAMLDSARQVASLHTNSLRRGTAADAKRIDGALAETWKELWRGLEVRLEGHRPALRALKAQLSP
jgi:hypothetical protein